METTKDDQPPMDADERGYLDGLTEKIIGAAYQVGNTLGNGYLEKVYENALRLELTKQGMKVEQQKEMVVTYEGEPVGVYYADLLIEARVMVELKAAKAIENVHHAQCLNYLKATGFKVCLLMNFGTPKVDVRRIVNGF